MALNARLDARFERKQAKKAQARVARMRDPIRGTATVVSSSDYRDSTTVAPAWTGCSITCVVQADGVPAQTSHQRAMTAPTAKWPWPNAILPITIDRAQPTEWIVHWEELQTSREINTARAEALASAMRGEPNAAATDSGTTDPLARLERLGQLHASGVLTDAEFAEQKAKILGSP